MSISILDKLERRQAEQLLSAMARRLLPDPGIAPPVMDIDEQLYSTLEAEARRALNLSAKDASEEARGKLLRLVADEITRLTLSKEQEASVKNRLGSRGDLRLNQYRLKFPQWFDEIDGRQGVRTVQATTNALRSVDEIEKITGSKTADGGEQTIALALKRMGKRYDVDKYVYLAEIIFHNTQIDVEHCWKIYNKDIDLLSDDSPLTTLEKFVSVFGLDFSIFGRPFTKLIIHDLMPATDEMMGLKPSRRPTPLQSRDFRFLLDAPVPIQLCSNARVSSAGVLELALIYAVNMNKYADAMKKRGIIAQT